MLNFTQTLFLYLLIPLGLVFTAWLAVLFLKLYSRPARTYGSKYPIIGRFKLWGLFIVPSAIFMVFALAKPTIDGRGLKPASGDIQIVVLLDNSISMRAADVRPSRLEIAKREVIDLMALLKEGDRIGLFAFGKTSNIKLYPTTDFGTFFDQAARISFPTSLSGDETLWSTDFATALEHIYQSLDRQDAYIEGQPVGKKYNPRKRDNRIVIVLSDGEDQMLNFIPADEQSLRLRAEYLKKRKEILGEYKKRGLKIYPLGVGTIKGVSWLSLLKGYKPGTDYPLTLETEWRGQTSRLDKSNLRELASLTGVQLAGYDWTVESYQDRSIPYLRSIVDSNRQMSLEFMTEESGQSLWQYCVLISVVFLVLGIATYPFKGYLRKG